MSIPFTPASGTFSHSTHKSKQVSRSKFTSSAADTEAVADERKGAEGTKGNEDKGVLELLGRLVDEPQRKANDYEVPVTATMFGEAGAETEVSYAQVHIH